MKKRYFILPAVIAGMLACAPETHALPAAALAEESAERAESMEEAAAVLERCRGERAGAVTLNCGGELYAQLCADRFSALNRLCGEAGITGFDLRYSDSQRVLKLSGIVWADEITYAWADTEEEAEEAVTGFVSRGVTGFTLGCSADVYGSLLEERGIYALLAGLGIGDFDLRYGSDTLYVENMRPYDTWAAATDVCSAADRLSVWREQGLREFTLVLGPENLNALSDDDLALIRFLSGMKSSVTAANPYSGALHFSSVFWMDGCSLLCSTEAEIVDAIRSMGAQGVTQFRIRLPQELFDAVTADSFARLHELEAEAGMSEAEMRYGIGDPVLYFSGAVIRADAKMLSTLGETIAYVDACVARQDEEITLFLTEDVYSALMSGVEESRLTKSDARIYDLTANAGIAGGDWTYSRDSRIVTLKNVRLYPGTRILLAVRGGTEAALSPRDAETLAAARKMAADCAGATPAETLRNIHDALCAGIVYTDDPSTDEDDCATGALLNGEANCDGYADALYLVGSLAGLEVRCQHGDSARQGFDSLFATHMWNLVKLDGTWRLVDVTWDDREDGTIYAWFNIGEDRASKTHVWSREMTVAMDPVTREPRPEPEYTVTDTASAADAVRGAEAKGYAAFTLIAADGSGLTENSLLSAVRDAASGGFRSMWLDGLDAMRIRLN